MAEAYKLKADASFPQVVREVETDEGVRVETVGRNYAQGTYVLASEMTPRDRERAENGDLDHLLEDSSEKEAQDYRARVGSEQFGVFIPEHESEAVVLDTYGHEVVPRDQTIQLKSAGAEAAGEALEASREGEGDKRPNLTAPDVPSTTARSKGDASPSEGDEDAHVDEERLRGVEQPPGVPVGQDAAEAAGAEPERKPRSRPRRSRQEKSEEGSGGSAQEKSE